jgi:hypothetical protein
MDWGTQASPLLYIQAASDCCLILSQRKKSLLIPEGLDRQVNLHGKVGNGSGC